MISLAVIGTSMKYPLKGSIRHLNYYDCPPLLTYFINVLEDSINDLLKLKIILWIHNFPLHFILITSEFYTNHCGRS